MERNHNHNQNRFRNRVMDMYRDLIALSNMNCNLTNNTIQQVETGIRELLRNDILNSNSRHSSIPSVNTQPSRNTINTRRSNHTNSYPIFNYDYPIDTFFTQNPLNIRRNTNTNMNTNANTNANTNMNTNANINMNTNANTNMNTNVNTNTRPSTSSIWTPLTPARHYRPSELFTTFAPTRINIDNLAPVIVRPTREQIINATETISIEEASGNTCPITQSPFQESDVITRIRHCGHTFAEVSLHTWFERSVICPVCRYDIRDYVPNESLTNNSNSNHHNTEPILESRHEPSPEPRDDIMIPEPNTENPAGGIIQSSAYNNTQDIENMVNMFANNISNTLREYATNNASNSNDDQGRIHFEYVIQTPTNTYTSSNLPTNSNSLNNLLFTPLMNNTNERITNNNASSANNSNSGTNSNSANSANSANNDNNDNNDNSVNNNSANSESSDDNVSDIENDDVNEAWNNDPF
jgi:hypothetical protein